MKSMIRIALFTLLFTGAVSAQTGNYLAAGASVIHSTSKPDSGETSVGPHIEAGIGLPYKLQYRLFAEYSPNPLLYSIYTSDADTGAVAVSELHARADLRYQFKAEGPIDPFVAAGVDLMKQFFEPTPKCQGTLATFGACGSRDSLSLNPTLTAGARIGEYTELSASRIFKGALNRAELSGYRANLSYHNHLAGPLSFKVGAEADYLYYRDTAPGYVANYYKNDVVVKVRFALMIGGREEEYPVPPETGPLPPMAKR